MPLVTLTDSGAQYREEKGEALGSLAEEVKSTPGPWRPREDLERSRGFSRLAQQWRWCKAKRFQG